MKPSNPEWYEDLKGNPFKTKTFTPSLVAKIKAQANHSSNNRTSILRRLSWTGFSIVCIAALLIFSFNKDLYTSIIDKTIQLMNMDDDSEAILRKLDTQVGYKITNQNKNVSISFRIEPEFIPKKNGDVFTLHREIYNDNNTKIYLERVALYNEPKNTRDLFIELTYQQHLSKDGGVFVSNHYYSGPNLVSNIMFEPQYFNDSGEELNINDGNAGDAAFFTPDQLSTLVGGLTLKFTGLNLIEYKKE